MVKTEAFEGRVADWGERAAPGRIELDWSKFPAAVRGSKSRIEVALAWGEAVVEVRHLSPGERLTCGPGPGSGLTLPETLCEETFELVGADLLGAAVLRFPRSRSGIYRLGEGSEFSLAEVTGATGPLGSVPLTEGSLVRVEFGALMLTVTTFRAEATLPRAPLAGFERETLGYFGLSLSVFGSFLATLAYFVPPHGLLDDAEIQKDRLVDLSHYMRALSEREKEREERTRSAEEVSAPSGGNTAASPGAAGAMGTPRPRMAPGRAAFGGPKSEATELARGAAVEEARHFGMNALLAAGFSGAVFERDRSLATDDVSARGDLFSASIGEVAGSGLGLHGLEESGGGNGPSVGMNSLFAGNVLGTNCPGNVPCGGGLGEFGRSVGRSGSGHVVRSPRVTPEGAVTLNGRLPAEVIRRTVRQNFGRFRFCYERGLAQNPSSEGRVAVRFVIGRDGSVSNVSTAANELGSAVGGCLVESFYGLSFPPPEGGIVTVTYPLLFSPG